MQGPWNKTLVKNSKQMYVGKYTNTKDECEKFYSHSSQTNRQHILLITISFKHAKIAKQ